MTGRLAAACLTLTLALAACNLDSAGPDALDDQINFDVATVAADGALEDLENIRDAEHRGPFEGSRTVTFYDAAGVEQADYDELTTARIVVVSEVSGEMSRDSWSASVARSREVAITGLEGEETTRTVNGTGASAVTRSRHSDEFGTRSYEMSGSSATVDLVLGVPREDNPYPLSGSISRDMTVVITNGPNGDETRRRTATIDFNGTRFATLTVDGETFEVDLDARRGEGAVRGGRGGRGFRGR